MVNPDNLVAVFPTSKFDIIKANSFHIVIKKAPKKKKAKVVSITTLKKKK